MNTHSAREYTMFSPAQILRTWCKHRPIKQDILDSNVMWQGWESLPHGGGRPASDFSFVLKCVIVVGLRFKWYTLYISFVAFNIYICIYAEWGGRM
jgi:hypothetical protein